MGITINTNTQSLFAQRALRSSTKMVGSSIERLSTGSRINRAGDDSAGLSITQKSTTDYFHKMHQIYKHINHCENTSTPIKRKDLEFYLQSCTSPIGVSDSARAIAQADIRN